MALHRHDDGTVTALRRQKDVAKLEEDLAVPHEVFLDACMEVGGWCLLVYREYSPYLVRFTEITYSWFYMHKAPLRDVTGLISRGCCKLQRGETQAFL